MKNKLYIIFFATLCICSCSLTPEGPPPYVISKPECLIDNMPGYFTNCAVRFNFTNTAGKKISKLYIGFMVYDADSRQNPFIGSNIIKMSFDGIINGGETKTFFAVLDSYIYVIPAKPYLIDFFYVSKIIYEDGSRWEDPNMVYYTNSY